MSLGLSLIDIFREKFYRNYIEYYYIQQISLSIYFLLKIYQPFQAFRLAASESHYKNLLYMQK